MKKISNNKKVTFRINEKEHDSKSNTNTIKKFDKENLIVAVRVRCLNSREVEFSNLDAIKIKNNELVTVLDPLEHLGKSDEVNNKREQQYAFDFAFDKNTTQDEVYTNTAKFLLDGVIEGFNATVFAYGATGAGKTYTMVGTGENPGVMVRSLKDLFSLVDMQKDKAIKIHISYVEIYNECLKDLLADSDGLKDIDIREDPVRGITLVGVNEILVSNVSEVFRMLM